ncbi:unnamed protein product [Caenorhabditis angaria]|uniref:Uncharacterized protein n=1 Tax=Caenorhabditis angaria TaxID=860376 RepID=A0A9P1N3N5_9PELO|nr:unnamed protein product [Caenorhabditis angaria]
MIGSFATLYGFNLEQTWYLSEKGIWETLDSSRDGGFRKRIIHTKIVTDVIFVILTYLTHRRMKKLSITNQKSILKLLILHVPIQIIFYVYQTHVMFRTNEVTFMELFLNTILVFEYSGNAFLLLITNKRTRTQLLGWFKAKENSNKISTTITF